MGRGRSARGALGYQASVHLPKLKWTFSEIRIGRKRILESNVWDGAEQILGEDNSVPEPNQSLSEEHESSATVLLLSRQSVFRNWKSERNPGPDQKQFRF